MPINTGEPSDFNKNRYFCIFSSWTEIQSVGFFIDTLYLTIALQLPYNYPTVPLLRTGIFIDYILLYTEAQSPLDELYLPAVGIDTHPGKASSEVVVETNALV